MKHGGKTKYIKTPDMMWELFTTYRDEKKSDPIIEVDFAGRDAKEVHKPHQRPLTMVGFSAWLYEHGIISDVWKYFSNYEHAYNDYVGICRTIKEVIQADQIEGGMAGIYNPSITQRLNGLTEKTDNTNSGSLEITVKYDAPASNDNPE